MRSAVFASACIAAVALAACQPRKLDWITPVDGPARIPPADSVVVLKSRNVKIDVGRIAGSAELALPTFDGETLRLIRDRTTTPSPGVTYWYGHVEGQQPSAVTLVIKGRVLIGNIRAGKRTFQIRYYRDDTHWLLLVDPNKYPDGGEPGAVTTLPDAEADACATDPPTDIDVLVLYSDDARTGAGSTDAMEATAFLALEETNQSYINSNVTQRLRLVHMEEVSYTETGVSMTDRDALRSTTDGILDNAHTLRNSHGADLVILLVESLENCGRAFIMNPASTAFETSAFAVVTRSCATGNFSFGHELAHIMSARHDWTADATNNSPNAFNHGHIVTAPADPSVGAWRTIMSQNTSCAGGCTRVMFWSNPFVNFPVGGATTDPMGTATGAQQTDNHQTLNNTAMTVANFRCSSPATRNVWMKDTWNDTGLEPDPATASEAMWRSPYIWVRNAQDAQLTHQHQHQNPEFGSTNFIYAKLHNGATTTQSGTLEVYFASASTSLSWPSDWTLLGSVTVNGLVGGSTRIIEQQWSSIPSTGHFCLLARWLSAADPMATPEGTNIGANVRANNNLVWRNVNVVDLTSGDAAEEDSVMVRNSDRRRPVPFSLVIAGVDDERRPSFLPVGDVSIRLSHPLATAWKNGGSRGNGFEVAGARLNIGKSGARLDNFMLPSGESSWLYVRMHRLPSTPRRDYWLEIRQVVGRSTVGGVTYEVHTDRIP